MASLMMIACCQWTEKAWKTTRNSRSTSWGQHHCTQVSLRPISLRMCRDYQRDTYLLVHFAFSMSSSSWNVLVPAVRTFISGELSGQIGTMCCGSKPLQHMAAVTRAAGSSPPSGQQLMRKQNLRRRVLTELTSTKSARTEIWNNTYKAKLHFNVQGLLFVSMLTLGCNKSASFFFQELVLIQLKP